VPELTLVFPAMTGWLHVAMEMWKPGCITPAQIDQTLAGHRLQLGGGFEDEEAAAQLEHLVQEVLSQKLPKVSPMDALHIVVHARDAGSALRDMRRGMAMGMAHVKHCYPRGQAA
jgi:hypothetical protein